MTYHELQHPRDEDSDLRYASNYAIDFPYDQIEDILACVYGENDGADWHWLVKMKDERIAYVRAGCDCQAGGDVYWFDSLEEALNKSPEREDDYNSKRPIRAILKDQLDGNVPFGVYETERYSTPNQNL